MPIETDSGNIDFTWRFKPQAEGQQELTYPVRLHKTPDFGWTVSFLDENNQPSLSLPASMFEEVWEHISTYVSPGARTVSQTVPTPSSGLRLPQIGRPVGAPPAAPQRPQAVPRTQIAAVQADGRTFVASEVSIDADTEEGEGVFLPDGHTLDDIELDPDDPTFETFTVPQKPVPARKTAAAKDDIDDDEERQRILEERAAAAKNKGKRGIKKRHSSDDE